MYNDHFLFKKLREREENDSLRRLSQPTGLIDFSSNDYLGISTNGLVQPYFTGKENHGSGGARTLSGNYALIEETEETIAQFHKAQAGLLFNSGYCANVGVMSSIPQRGDTVLYDYLAHASIRDGIRLSHAEAFSFKHNDLDDLENKLKKTKGNVFVATESVFSMDGDLAPLYQMVELCERFGAHLVVDEAHATGIIGHRGEGLVQLLGLEQRVFARIHTFGKAVGTHGAVVVGSAQLKSYLLNFARSFIFTTALPPSAVTAIKAAYALFPAMHKEREHLQKLAEEFHNKELPFEKLSGNTPIKAVIVPGNSQVKAIAKHLQQSGFDVRPILYPTVPKEKERLRINLHAFNTAEQVNQMLISLTNSQALDKEARLYPM
jgi:8-amino-7-oxononanoate synthase